jgi:D-3-phosphoglycerate dehydrogenase
MINQLEWLSRYNLDFFTFSDRPDESQESFQKRMLEMEVHGPSEELAPPGLINIIKDINILVVHFTNTRKIPVSNSPGRSADAVADFTIGLMICESKNIIRSSIALRNGLWEKKYFNSNYHYNLKGQTVGLIGFGQVGSRVAKKLSGFEVNILVYDSLVLKEIIIKAGCQPVELDYLLQNSDFVSLHYRYSEETKNILGSREISLMKPTTYLINTAREGLVDSKALYKALKNRKIGGAALDVFDVEPLPNDSPFLQLENVTLTPHLAGHSLNSMITPFEILGKEIDRFLKNEPLKFVKNENNI